MNCPGSTLLLNILELPETDEPDYRAEGTAGHEAAAVCLNEVLDAWEVMHRTFSGVVINQELADAIQVYIDYVRGLNAVEFWVEYSISAPVHEKFYGTLDFGCVVPRVSLEPGACPPRFNTNVVRVVDLKMGKGIVVEVADNPQLKYYAGGLISHHPEWLDDMPVILAICQPRVDWHPDGVIREWETTVGEIRAWLHDELVPAMLRAEYDDELNPGPWCRFCPAKLICPMLTGLARAAALANPKEVPHLTDERLAKDYQYREAIKFYLKAQEDETLRRAMKGATLPGIKLVTKKAFRVYTPQGQKLAPALFGDDAYEDRKLKSPPELEKLGPEAKDFVKEHAYKPDTGLTIALDTDPRQSVKVSTATETFGAALSKLQGTKQ